jgi:hypothetical protein
MAFTTCSVATNNISSLDDQPNDVGGLTAAELKAAFDKFGKDFVAWFNETHVAELDGLAGEGHTDETVKGNADALVSHKNETAIHTKIIAIEEGTTEPTPENGALLVVYEAVS